MTRANQTVSRLTDRADTCRDVNADVCLRGTATRGSSASSYVTNLLQGYARWITSGRHGALARS